MFLEIFNRRLHVAPRVVCRPEPAYDTVSISVDEIQESALSGPSGNQTHAGREETKISRGCTGIHKTHSCKTKRIKKHEWLTIILDRARHGDYHAISFLKRRKSMAPIVSRASASGLESRKWRRSRTSSCSSPDLSGIERRVSITTGNMQPFLPRDAQVQLEGHGTRRKRAVISGN